MSARLAGILFSVLPASVYLSVREGHDLVRRLDYSRKTIRMGVGSFAELDRLRSCRKEPETVAWLDANLRRGDVFYDIGANVGAYSLVACAMLDGDCTVCAFEPSHTTFASLARNILLNHDQGTVFPFLVALASETRLLHLGLSSPSPGAALHKLYSEEPLDRPSLATAAYRLDDFVNRFELAMPNLMKVDVDGYEYEVLMGADAVLSSMALRSVLVEVDERSETCGPIHRHLEAKGFHLSSVHPHADSTIGNRVFLRNSSIQGAR